MLLSEYLKIGSALENKGIFDPVLNEDSHFFINIQRLKRTDVPEFRNSYERIHEYFRVIIKLLDKAKKKDISDTFYKEALRRFKFSEVNGICLGYAKGKSGAGFGSIIGRQIVNTAYDIVKAGILDPEFFELLPLFQENVGADRLSDMIATLILDDIKTYTRNINRELNITSTRYSEFDFNNGFLINPYKKGDVLLVPIDILHKLPVAKSWEDIDTVVSENDTIRKEMNSEVALEWEKYSTNERKEYLKRDIFENPAICKRVIDGYRMEELSAFNPQSDFTYLLSKIAQKFDRAELRRNRDAKAINSYIASMEIIGYFKQWVEYNKGWEVLWAFEGKQREKMLQRLFHGQAKAYISANGFDMSCEPDEGRGLVDFKTSFGKDKTLIEVKLTTNSQYLHGYDVQLEEYGKSEGTNSLIYVLIDLGHPGKVQKVQESHDKKYNDRMNPPELIVIDATKKLSASKA